MTNAHLPKLEIAVQDLAGAIVARDGGADRIELCTALGATGGLTPSPGTLDAALTAGIATHPLIRSRPGGFVYDAAELDVLVNDVRFAVERGAAGVVIGALTPEGTLDERACRTLVAAAKDPAARDGGRSVEVTFHRALDTLDDPVEALRRLADLGVDRVLTSGGAPRAGDGLAVLGRLAAAGTGVQIMAGGGVRVTDIAALADAGVDAIHLSAKAIVADRGLTGPGGGEGGGLEVTDPAVVAQARAAIAALA